MGGKDYTQNEESYVRKVYRKLDDAKYMTPLLGGRAPCKLNKSTISLSCLEIKSDFTLREVSPKELSLILGMRLESDEKREANVRVSKFLSDESGGGILSEKMTDEIIRCFLVPALKSFYRTMHPQLSGK